MKVKIFQPAKSAMQSGVKNSKKWLLVPVEENNSRNLSKLMGWVSSNNTNNQLRFEFLDKESAIKFAKDQGYEYHIEEPNLAIITKKSYTENFTQ